MLHRITGRATKCGPSAISAIAGVPTHEAAAVIRRLFDRPSVNGVHTDELAAALEEFGWAPDYALRHPKYRERRHARREEVWERIFSDVPFEVRAVTLSTFLDPAPAGTWAISASNHFIAYSDGFVADSGAMFSRVPAFWYRAVADELQAIQRRNFYQVRASISQKGRYCHEYSMAFEIERDSPTWQPMTDGAEETVIEALRDLARWLYRQIRSEYEYQTSDEAVDEIVEANQWTFKADGTRFG